MKRWNFKLENEICPTCKGEGSILEGGDLHRSEGWIPCPMKYFQGHGYPTCGKDGKLHFSEYDIKNKKKLMKDNLKHYSPTDANNVLAVRALIGKKVNVDIGCYSYGFCYPDENILVDLTETEYVFKSDEIDSEDQLWRFPIKDDNCSCVVSLA